MIPVSLHLMEMQTIPSYAWAQRSFVSRFLPGEAHPSLLRFSCISAWIPYSVEDTWRARNRTLKSSCPQLLLLGSPPPNPLEPWEPDLFLTQRPPGSPAIPSLAHPLQKGPRHPLLVPSRSPPTQLCPASSDSLLKTEGAQGPRPRLSSPLQSIGNSHSHRQILYHWRHLGSPWRLNEAYFLPRNKEYRKPFVPWFPMRSWFLERGLRCATKWLVSKDLPGASYIDSYIAE
ncbi:uncharacterized protein LOC129649800 isoform X3 [Bubalus kerabau]|uniref:uncharacterized protein LOC129649800 isoform X3 n=1 Tax=Bubalus carabanensis TaxID=3119969 RepID=UPI00244EAA19|nr:uncharacterized protein LOC129649800 isoform X3 [Bubalus carabanensis]